LSDKTGYGCINKKSNFDFPKLTKKEKDEKGNLYIGGAKSSQFKVNQFEIFGLLI
jgi:hypothetical protein